MLHVVKYMGMLSVKQLSLDMCMFTEHYWYKMFWIILVYIVLTQWSAIVWNFLTFTMVFIIAIWLLLMHFFIYQFIIIYNTHVTVSIKWIFRRVKFTKNHSKTTWNDPYCFLKSHTVTENLKFPTNSDIYYLYFMLM